LGEKVEEKKEKTKMARGKKNPARKNVTTACLKCKSSKTRCTGSFPCGNCTKRAMNGCGACKNNIKNANKSNLEACNRCIFQASNFYCKFPQEKARRGPPPRQMNQRAINNTTINKIDNSDNNCSGNSNKNNIINNDDNNLLVSPCDSIISTFSPIPSLSPSNAQHFYIPSPPDTPSFNLFCEARSFDYYSNKESSMVLDSKDDSLFHEFFFEEPIPDGSDNKPYDNNGDIFNNNNNDDNNDNDSNNNNDKDNNKLSPLLLSMATTPTVTIPTATIPTTTSVMAGIGNNHYNCTSTQLHTLPYIYILQSQDFVPCEHPPSTEMDPLLGHSQAPPSIFAQEGTEESAPQAPGIATRKMISSSDYENFIRSSTFFL